MSEISPSQTNHAEGLTPLEASPLPSRVVRSARGSGRWWMAVLLGSILSLPIGMLLSYAATLPFYLGLFFFVLFGLVIGALTHRLAAKARPFPRHTILCGTTVIVLVCWTFSVYMESREVPGNLAQLAARARSIGNRPLDEFLSSVESSIRLRLRERYPPGGVVGFVRWVVVSGRFARGEIDGVERTLTWRQHGLPWVLRCALSVAMLGLGVGSQTFLLRLDRDPIVRQIDEKPKI